MAFRSIFDDDGECSTCPFYRPMTVHQCAMPRCYKVPELEPGDIPPMGSDEPWDADDERWQH